MSDDGLSNLCQVDGQLNVGETQMTKFSSNRPVKSTLTAGKSLVKPALNILPTKIRKLICTAFTKDIVDSSFRARLRIRSRQTSGDVRR